MRPIKPNMRRRPLWRTVLLSLGAIVIGGAGTVAALAGLKVIDPAKLAFWRSKEAHPAGWIRHSPKRPIDPRLHGGHPGLLDESEDWRVGIEMGTAGQRFPKGVITDLSKILGRVTAREKPAVYFFKESDFLPAGTRPGVVGGTPQGKRAYTFNAASLEGCVYQLKEGDHVDLMVSVPVDMPGAGRSNSGPSGASVMATPDTLLRPKRTLEIPLVQDGVVVSPVTARMHADHEQFAHERHDHPQRAGGGDRDRRGARRSGAAGRGQGLEVQAHLRGAFGPPGDPLQRLPCSGRPAGPRRVECLRSLPRWARRFWANRARPRRTRLRRRANERKPSTQRRAKRLPRIGWQWTSRPA